MISILASLFAALAGFGCLYLLTAILIVMVRKPKGVARPAPEPVTLMKPLYGAEPWLSECLASFCHQDYAGPIQIVFGVQDRSDPALGVVERLQERFPNLDIALVVDGTKHGTHGKISNLINMNRAAKHDILIVSDSDIRVGADYVAQIVALLQRPKAGGASILYYGEAAGPVWSRFVAAWIDTHFLPSVLIGMALGLAKPCFGSTIALKRDVLAEIGGFEAFANQMADDYAIGDAVRKAGFGLEIGPAAVGHVCQENTPTDLFAHQLRWARTIRSIDPAGYFGSVVSHPLPLALLGALAGSAICLWLAVLALSIRIVLSKAVARSFGAPGQPVWTLPLTDLLAFGIFAWSFLGSKVSWNRKRYTVLDDGTMAPSR